MKKAAVLLADGFEEIEAVTPIDILRRGGVEVTVYGVTGERVTGSHRISLTADAHIGSADPVDFDAVIIPGGMPGAVNIAQSPDAEAFIRAVHDKGGLVGAICAAPAKVLAPMGLLDGKKATCYPGFEKEFKGVTAVEDPVVIDGKIVTSRGPGSAAEFSLTVLGILAGKETAGQVRQSMLFL